MTTCESALRYLLRYLPSGVSTYWEMTTPIERLTCGNLVGLTWSGLTGFRTCDTADPRVEEFRCSHMCV
jgi:hypothetical protein